MLARLERVVGFCEGASRGAAVRAGNRIGDDGAASLAPSLGRMTQLTMLDLRGMLRASAGSCAVSGCLRMPAVHGWCCVLWAEVVVRGGAGAGGGVCEGRAEGRRCVQTMGSEHQQQQLQLLLQQQKLQLQQKKLQLLLQQLQLQLQLLMQQLQLLMLLLLQLLMLLLLLRLLLLMLMLGRR